MSETTNLSFSDNKVGQSGQASSTVGGEHKPEAAADSAEKQGKDAMHMRHAVSTIVAHNKLMSDNPSMYKAAHAHVKKHGHKAMEMLPKAKISSIQDLRDMAKAEPGEAKETIAD
jgi:hypothetical protein